MKRETTAVAPSPQISPDITGLVLCPLACKNLHRWHFNTFFELRDMRIKRVYACKECGSSSSVSVGSP
jgi:hypothetical protein